ncbi:MAG: SH3 domain-containing protein [Rectinemataceae bacterium]|nr:SH3 domain-containing protein [Spirochaetaceae bacterium]
MRHERECRIPASPSRLVASMLLLIMGIGVLSACKPRIVLPREGIFDSKTWLAVTVPFAALRDNPEDHAQVKTLLRRGTVLPIRETKIQGGSTNMGLAWYRVDSQGITGWVSSSEVQAFSSEWQARKAAAGLE